MNNRHTPKPAYAAPSECGGRFSDEAEKRIREDIALQTLDWMPAFQAVATKLLDYQGKSKELLKDLYQVPKVKDALSYFEWKNDEKTEKIPLSDICPFTVMGTFNLEPPRRNDKELTKQRVAILKELCKFLGIDPDMPTDFSAVPTLRLARPWFFARADKRNDGDIDALWDVFVAAAKLADHRTGGTSEVEDNFASAYDRALEVSWTNWKLSMGLYWTNPEYYLTLDINSREFITRDPLKLDIPVTGAKGVCKAKAYLDLMRRFRVCFEKNECPFNSFIELSRAARKETEKDDLPDTY